MTGELIFTTNVFFDDVIFDSDSASWTFHFADKIYAGATGFWRLFKKNKIVFVSFDHGHTFGFFEPLNVIEGISNELKNQRLTQIEVRKDTCDLVLTLTNELGLENLHCLLCL